MESMFDAGQVVTDLRYNFTKFRPDPDAADLTDEERERRKLLADLPWEGTIPEPSDDDIERLFNQELPSVRLLSQKAMTELLERQQAARRDWWEHNKDSAPAGQRESIDQDGLFELPIPSEMLDAEQNEYLRVTHDARLEQRARTLAAVAAFCHELPPRQVLEALPWRVFQHFTGWLTGQFRPEAIAAAMNA